MGAEKVIVNKLDHHRGRGAGEERKRLTALGNSWYWAVEDMGHE